MIRLWSNDKLKTPQSLHKKNLANSFKWFISRYFNNIAMLHKLVYIFPSRIAGEITNFPYFSM